MLKSPAPITYVFDKILFTRIVIFLIVILFIGHCLSLYFLFEYPDIKENGSFLGKLTQLFNFDIEANLPTYFSSLLLFFNALLLTFITFAHKQSNSKYRLWAGLAIIFFYLSFDEMIAIHEHLIQPTRSLLNTTGYLYYAWILPYGIVLFLLGLIYARFLWRLPRKVMLLFSLAALVFISGAIGMESLGAMQDDKYGRDNLTYHLMYTLEELLEMTGSTIFCFALLTYIDLKFKITSFKFQKK